MQTLTETEVRTLYKTRQAEPFPARKNVMGIILALIFIMGTIAAWIALLWVIATIAQA